MQPLILEGKDNYNLTFNSLILPFQGRIRDFDLESNFCLYEVRSSQYSCIGLVCSIRLEEAYNGAILRHEDTIPKKTASLYQAFLKTKTQHNPILLITDEKIFEQKMKELSSQAQTIKEYWPTEETSHRLLKISHQQFSFKLFNSLCVADGHHRLYALWKYYQNKKVPFLNTKTIMAVIFSAMQVQTRTKGIIVNRSSLTTSFFWEKLIGFFNVTLTFTPKEPQNSREFCMFFSNAWYHLTLKPQFYQKQHEELLGIEIFKYFVLNKIFSFSSYTSNDSIRIFFDSCNITSVRELSTSEHTIGFVISADPCKKIMHATRTGRILEPNSTYFEPKLINGILMHSLEDL